MENVTAVVPARNCRAMLHRCLLALAGGTHAPRIIVVDDASEDGTADMVRERWPEAVLFSLTSHTGYAHAVNAGLRLVQTKYALVIRPDLLPGKSCVERLVDALGEAQEEGPGHLAGSGQGSVFCAVPRVMEASCAKAASAEAGNASPEAGLAKAGNASQEAGPAKAGKACPEAGLAKAGNASQEAGLAKAGNASPEAGLAKAGNTCPEAGLTKAGNVCVKAQAGAGRGGKRHSSPASCGEGTYKETLAVSDGCALYRMEILEQIGWMDERHYEGLEAFDLCLRAALYGFKTVQAPGALVKKNAACLNEGQKDAPCQNPSLFRLQLAAGNGPYVLYKNIPSGLRLTLQPLLLGAKRAQRRAFLKCCGTEQAADEACLMAIGRGRMLCYLDRERRAALDAGVPVYPESLGAASYLGMEEENDHIYPLYLAEKEPFMLSRLPQYLRIGRLLAADAERLQRLFSANSPE